MSKTVVRKNESLEDALRRFKRTVSKNGTIQEVRKREFYEKPSVKRKKKSEAARKRNFNFLVIPTFKHAILDFSNMRNDIP